MNKLRASLEQKKLTASMQEKKLTGRFNEKLNITPVQYHNELLNLDYEHSGHTGFASAEQVKLLLPKDISILPKNTLQNRNAQVYLYDPSQEENKETQVTVAELLDTKIKTVETVPDNLQLNDYIFLEIK